jgi:hypothetical protein
MWDAGLWIVGGGVKEWRLDWTVRRGQPKKTRKREREREGEREREKKKGKRVKVPCNAQ